VGRRVLGNRIVRESQKPFANVEEEGFTEFLSHEKKCLFQKMLKSDVASE